jgi:carbonic anhydrase
VVFLVALPLSLGIALASGAPVVSGVIAAVVGGIVAGLAGGVPLQVTGPAAGLTAVVAGLITEHGWQVTCLITVLAGLVQIALGFARVARAALAISPAVVHGMLAGIGITIVAGQLHVLTGGSARSTALASLLELPAQVIVGHTPSAMLGLGAIVVTLLWRRVPPRFAVVPGPLVSVALLTIVSLPFPVQRVDLPANILSGISLPALPRDGWPAVLIGVVTVALVASVESILSATAVDKMHDGKRGDLDRELLGQGAANSLSGLAGGLPVTGVIVRSSANVRAGARTRWSAVLHAVWIALFSLLLVALVRQIPLSVLAGLLVVIGIGLVDLGHLRTIHRHGEAVVWLATVAGVVLFSLLEGVMIGLGVSLLFAVRSTLFAPVQVIPPQEAPSPLARRARDWRVVVHGTVTFLSVPRLASQLARVPAQQTVRLELQVDHLDHAAAEHLLDWVGEYRKGGGQVEIEEIGAPVLSRIRDGRPLRGRELLDGVEKYHEGVAPRLRSVMDRLRHHQSPTTLFITCADSRIVPNMITSSGPGDLFTVRNVGNLVPGHGAAAGDSTLAAVEYAVEKLRVSTIAVCGHSGCGAMQALLEGPRTASGPGAARALPAWLAHARTPVHGVDGQSSGSLAGLATDVAPEDADRLARRNVLQQLDHLRQHPVVARALEEGTIALVGMFYDIGLAQALVLDPDSGTFEPMVRSGA